MAQDKLAQFLAIVPVIVILTWLARRDMSWLYLQRGRPRRWLAFGLAGFLAGLVAMVWILISSGMSAGSLLRAAPWILTFVAANAVMEELWFRGIFLRPYEVEAGWTATMVLTALAYGTSHMSATYFESSTGLMFGLGVIGLGLILAWSIRWSSSLWGAVLFHMGMDLVIILPIVQSI
jgi:membrane protease YdiL (CAAX protease family)